MLQNNTLLDSNFEWIFSVLASKNESKIEQLRIFIENTNFAKIIVFLKGNRYFSGSEPQKIYQKWMLKRHEK